MTASPMIEAMVKIASWMRTNRVSIQRPPSSMGGNAGGVARPASRWHGFSAGYGLIGTGNGRSIGSGTLGGGALGEGTGPLGVSTIGPTGAGGGGTDAVGRHRLHAGSERVVGVVPVIAGVAGGGDQLCAFDAPPGAQTAASF